MRSTVCRCDHCRMFGDLRPGDREEFQNPGRALIETISAFTHARVGWDVGDEWTWMAASHCDLDRALRLLEVLRIAANPSA